MNKEYMDTELKCYIPKEMDKWLKSYTKSINTNKSVFVRRLIQDFRDLYKEGLIPPDFFDTREKE